MVADQNGNLLFEFERRTQKLMNWVPILASAGQEPLGGACELFAKLVFPVGLFALAERLAPGRPSSAICAIIKESNEPSSLAFIRRVCRSKTVGIFVSFPP